MGGAVAALAVRQHFAVGRDARALVHLPQFGRRLEGAVRAEVPRPFDVDGAGYRAAALRADGRAAVLAVASRVEDHRIPRCRWPIFTSRQVAIVCELARAGPVARRRRRSITRNRQSGPAPGAESAVEQPHRRMAEILEEPERARRADAGLLVVDDDRASFATPCIASTCSIIHMNALSGAGSVSIRLTPHRSRWIAPGT